MGERVKIMIIGNYGDYNIGDEAILRVLYILLKKKYKDIELDIPCRDKNFMNLYHQEIKEEIKPIDLSCVKEILKHTKEADKIIVGGGGIWSGYTGKAAKLLPLYIIFSKLIYRKDTQAIGIGFYKTSSHMERILVNLGFLFTEHINVRDKESYENIWKYTRNKKAVLDEDLVMKIPLYIKESKIYERYYKKSYSKKILSRIKNKKILGVSIKPSKNKEENSKIIKEFSEFLMDLESNYARKVFVLFFPFAKTDSLIEDDLKFMQQILKKINLKKLKYHIMEHEDPLSWLSVIKEKVDFFIGMRFHSLIFSHIAEKPYVGIPYENKVREFLKIQNKGILEINDVESRKLLSYTKNYLRL